MKTNGFIVLMISLLTISVGIMVLPGCGNPTGGGSGVSGGTGILYVSGYTNNCILVYDNANTREGTSSPDRLISGGLTQLNQPNSNGLFIDAKNDKLYVTNRGNHSILVFDNASTLDGNVAPEQVISYEGMVHPEGIFVRKNRIYVADVFNQYVFVFDSTAEGQTVPLVSIESTSVNVVPEGIYIDSNNKMYVAGNSDISQRIYVFNNVDTLTSGLRDLVPDRIISCEALDNLPFAVWVDENKNILYADNASASDILTFNHASTLNGANNYSSSAEISGNPYHFAVDTNKNILYVSNSSNIQVWTNSNTLSGTAERTIAIPVTYGGKYFGIAIDTTRD